ncbi:MAG TPA: hypothetical protein VN376_07670, partial [Longilinea sp.]|nr:hypothetical protein [Longilinea sp.]
SRFAKFNDKFPKSMPFWKLLAIAATLVAILMIVLAFIDNVVWLPNGCRYSMVGTWYLTTGGEDWEADHLTFTESGEMIWVKDGEILDTTTFACEGPMLNLGTGSLPFTLRGNQLSFWVGQDIIFER